MRKIAVVTQARMNSTRVPNKMTRDFAGTTLFDILLSKLNSTRISLEDIWICVGEKPLIDIAKKHALNIIIRSQESCDSTNSSKPDSLKLLYEWYDFLSDLGYTHVILVSACNPLLKAETIQSFYDRFKYINYDGMFSVIEKHNYYWDKNGKAITDWKGAQLMNTRKVELIYEGAHCLYGSKIDFIEKELWMDSNYPPEPEMFPISGIEAVDIDTLEDFEIAEVLYKNFK